MVKVIHSAFQEQKIGSNKKHECTITVDNTTIYWIEKKLTTLIFQIIIENFVAAVSEPREEIISVGRSPSVARVAVVRAMPAGSRYFIHNCVHSNSLTGGRQTSPWISSIIFIVQILHYCRIQFYCQIIFYLYFMGILCQISLSEKYFTAHLS